jgi:hypothetical protein
LELGFVPKRSSSAGALFSFFGGETKLEYGRVVMRDVGGQEFFVFI